VSSTSYAAPLHVAPQRSNWIRNYLVLQFIILCTAFSLIPILLWIKVVCLGFLVLINVHYWRKFYLATTPSAIKQATWREDGEWELVLSSGELVEANLITPVFCHRP
jgi:hypothetical protein